MDPWFAPFLFILSIFSFLFLFFAFLFFFFLFSRCLLFDDFIYFICLNFFFFTLSPFVRSFPLLRIYYSSYFGEPLTSPYARFVLLI